MTVSPHRPDARGFTPGPWEAVLLNDMSDATYVEGPQFASSRAFTTDELEDGLQQRIHADARLIAAAPDMYEALRHIIGFLDTIEVYPTGDHISKSGLRKMSLPALDVARAALARVVGEAIPATQEPLRPQGEANPESSR